MWRRPLHHSCNSVLKPRWLPLLNAGLQLCPFPSPRRVTGIVSCCTPLMLFFLFFLDGSVLNSFIFIGVERKYKTKRIEMLGLLGSFGTLLSPDTRESGGGGEGVLRTCSGCGVGREGSRCHCFLTVLPFDDEGNGYYWWRACLCVCVCVCV